MQIYIFGFIFISSTEKVKILTDSFYQRQDTLEIAKELLGKKISTRLNGVETSGIITETEAYLGVEDRACHAFGGRRTSRTEVMYQKGGVAYIYLCYGIHSLFNVVTHEKGVPHAVLVRAIFPVSGTREMQIRRNGKPMDVIKMADGPGKVSSCLGFTPELTGEKLNGKKIGIYNVNFSFPDSVINVGQRIGVEYAGKDAKLPYRFWVNHKEINSRNFLSSW